MCVFSLRVSGVLSIRRSLLLSSGLGKAHLSLSSRSIRVFGELSGDACYGLELSVKSAPVFSIRISDEACFTLESQRKRGLNLDIRLTLVFMI